MVNAHTAALILGYTTTAGSLLTMWLLGKHRRSGWAVSFFNQFQWFALAFVTGVWSLYIGAALFTALAVHGWVKWQPFARMETEPGDTRPDEAILTEAEFKRELDRFNKNAQRIDNPGDDAVTNLDTWEEPVISPRRVETELDMTEFEKFEANWDIVRERLRVSDEAVETNMETLKEPVISPRRECFDPTCYCGEPKCDLAEKD